MKRILSTVIILLLLSSMMIVPVSAAIKSDGSVDIMALYYRSATAFLDIENDGTALLEGKINGIPGTTTKTTVHLYLQQYKDGKWENVDDWLSTGETVNRSLTKSKQVTKGYKYRAKASCYAYSGTKCEHVTKYSTAVSY